MTSATSLRLVSPLRARMIEDMTVRGFNEHTRRDYVRHVRSFAAFIGRSPDTATAEELRPSNCTRRRSACSRRASTARSQPCASSSR
jgi:Phage integrase, N-terminal SAM-like domain